ncbi:MAG: hypothetical protein JW829_01370 [Pirellulales bacterium]|nr:hypothetical protein [Pirellulales bacterium]
MPIHVTCPGCHTRFRVSEKFAGKEGSCPKCKATIHVPKLSEQVVVHVPEHSERGALDSKGRPILKPIARKDTIFQPWILVAVLVAAGTLFGIAWLLRGMQEKGIVLLVLGAIVLGPPIAWAGYTFLRDPELEAYRGRPLLIRTAVCGLVYAILWGLFCFVKWKLWGDTTTDASAVLFQAIILAVPFLGFGTFLAYVIYDLDPGSAFFHYALYVLVTVLLCLTMGQPIL